MLKKFFIIIVLLLQVVFVIMPVKANQLLSVSDTMSRLKMGVLANHTIQFTTSSGIAAGETITIAFPAGFNLGTVDYTDIDLKDDAAEIELGAAATSTVWGVATSTGNIITFTNGITAVDADSAIEIEIGTNAAWQTAGNAQISNPNVVGSQIIRIAGTFGDTATLAVVILDDDQVIVTATVLGGLTFSIAPLATSTVLGGSDSASTNSVQAATTSTLPFGEQTIGQGTVLGQQVIVSTNANNGYIVTLQQNQDLGSGANDIDDFFATNAVPQKWENTTHPTSTVPSVDTGWFGYTTADDSLSIGSPARFGSGTDRADYWAGLTATSTAYEIAYNDSVVIDGETTNVGFKLEINAYQPAGYYSGTVLTYICTGLF
ncbi:hypothetical protein KJ627_03850 [Patescibacteria group bacterium]|nr:hypothetical protein [Patescibacteria group bacterium]MBU1934151.1 hypothetical protein [Patescibacteria group bacterium]MBU2007533.1 hypothetical protein [Patescibacteria group bacterium]MBU2233964.1 hypothetical protein [Patescibacteria group bacterium]MBU2264432.1 hypothetical protein [Patescibacteria group bacterium]